jgi:hypothetical protein
LRWTSAKPGDVHGFEVAEINAFGDMPLAMLNTMEIPDIYASNTSALQFPGESGPDFSNTLGTLANPPDLPIVSP